MKLKLASVCVFGGAMGLAISAEALTGATPSTAPLPVIHDSGNPYAIITDRNIFRLSPPPVAAPVEPKPVELPKINLNGIIKIGDDVRVLFSIPPKDAKSQVAYFKLAPGEMASGDRDDHLELVKIHPNQQEVDVLINGTPMTLSVMTNSPASAGSKAPNPGQPRRGPEAIPMAAGAPAAPAAPGGAGGGSSAIVIGGGRNSSSSSGGVAVSGGDGVTIIGGGNNGALNNGGNSFGGGVSVGGGGGNTAPSYGGGVSVAGGNTAPVNTPGAQIATTLFSGTQNNATTSTPAPAGTPATAAQQAAAMIIQNALNPNGPPLPPPVARAAGDEGVLPPPPP